MDDLGSGELRVTRDEQWRLSNLLQPLRNMLLAIMFEWGTALQGLHSAHHRAATDAEKTAQTRGLIRKFAGQAGKGLSVLSRAEPSPMAPHAHGKRCSPTCCAICGRIW